MKILPFSVDRAEDALRLLNPLRAVPIDLSEFLTREARWPAEDLRLRWLGLEDDRAVAFGQLATSPYAPTDHLSVAVSVASEHRGHGKASIMLAFLEQEAIRQGFRGLVATVPEASSAPQTWAEAHGFDRYALHCDSLVDLQTFDRELVIPADVQLSDMTEANPENWQDVARLLQSLIADAPDMQGLPPWSLTRCLSVLRESPASRPEWVIVARSRDRPVGLTVGHLLGEEIYSFFTGVVPDWRGKGVGLALKLHLIATARAQGIATMRTTNLDLNLPALRLNVSLGFRRVPGSVEFRKRLKSEI